MESVFRQELVEVISGDAAWDLGEALPDQVRIFVAQGSEFGVNFATPATARNDLGAATFRRQPSIADLSTWH